MPNELLPTNIGFGTVVGRFGSAPLIAGDADGFPDFSPATGLTVTFTPSTAAVIDATASPAPVTIEMVPIVCGLDSQGYLVGGDGQRGVKLIATDDTDINPSGWTYSVTFLRAGAKVAAFRDFSMALPAGVTKDIALTIPVPSSSGVSLSQAQAAEAAAVNAASAATAAAAAAAASAATFVPATVDTLGQATTVGKALAKASDATAAQTAIGATAVGKALVTAADTAAAQTAIGATATGKALTTAASAAAARVAISAVGNGDLEFNVLSYYSGTGNHDAALAAASAAAGTAGGVVRIPSNITITTQYTQPTGVRLRGPGTMGGGSRPGATLRANIIGGGPAIKAATGAGALAIEGLAVVGGSSFTGVLVDYSGVSVSEIRHSLLQANNSAADLLYLDQALYHTSHKVNYAGGNVQVTGKTADNSFSNAVAFRDCRFGNGATAHVKNAGEAWVFDGGAIEYIDNGAAGFYRHDPGVRAKNMTIRNMWMGDITATPNGGTQIVWSGDNLTIEDSMLGWNDGTLLQIDENACNGITLKNNRYNAFHTNSPTIAVDFGSTTGHAGFVFLSPKIHTPLSQIINGTIPTGSLIDTGVALITPPLGAFDTPNLLSDNDSLLTTSAAGWRVFDVTKNSVARSTAIKFGTDVASLVTTTIAAGPQDIRVQQLSGATSVPVIAGGLYTFGVTLAALDAARNADMIIDWHDAGGAFLSSSVSSSAPYLIAVTAMTVGAIKQMVFPNVLVPTGAAFARITPRIYATQNTERFAMGRFFAVAGAATGWRGAKNTVTVDGFTIRQNSASANAGLVFASKGGSPVGVNTELGGGTGGLLVGDGTGAARGSLFARKWVHTESTNDTQGVATMVAGTVTVATTALLAGDRIRLTGQNAGAGSTTWGALTVSAQTAGTSFVISSSLNTDTRAVLWEIIGVG